MMVSRHHEAPNGAVLSDFLISCMTEILSTIVTSSAAPLEKRAEAQLILNNLVEVVTSTNCRKISHLADERVSCFEFEVR